jgi:hypothetical protein
MKGLTTLVSSAIVGAAFFASSVAAQDASSIDPIVIKVHSSA